VRAWWSNFSRTKKVITVTLLAVILLISGFGAVDGLMRYSSMTSLAKTGMQHLRAAQAIVGASKNAPTILFDTTKRGALTSELTAAEQNFSQLRAQLHAPGGSLWVASVTPGLSGTTQSAARLAFAADEACLAGLALLQIGPIASTWLAGDIILSASDTAPKGGVNQEQVSEIAGAVRDALAHARLAINSISLSDLAAMPGSLVSATQRAQLEQFIRDKDKVQEQLSIFASWIDLLPALLGISAPEQFLFMLQDRSELRPTGGFLGNFAILTVRNGQLQPFSLEDTYSLDFPYTSKYGSLPFPDGYPWFPLRPFGLRDSNLNADMPTAAQTALRIYKTESGGSTPQGMILITPVIMQTALLAVGPVTVPEWGDKVTAANLEATIHKHQLTVITKGERKAFTAALAQEVMKRIKAMPRATLLSLAFDDLKYFQTKDIQMYFTDQKAEDLLRRSKVDGSIATGAGDGVMVVDSNIGGNKGSQFTTVKYVDQVTVDQNGAATHVLQIIYNFKVTDFSQLYGQDLYHTYARVYLPPKSTLVAISGFSGAQPKALGAADIPNRTMIGGTVLAHDGRPLTVTVSWSVPAIVSKSGDVNVYQLLYQHQAGSKQSLKLTVKLPNSDKPVAVYDGALDTDKQFTLRY
jgi:hypothetical protein